MMFYDEVIMNRIVFPFELRIKGPLVSDPAGCIAAIP